MAVLRTPDERFRGLEDYDFEPHYVTITDQRLGPLRMHYLDEGDPAAPVVLMLHGEPTWSYLFRHAVAPLVAAGRRVVTRPVTSATNRMCTGCLASSRPLA
jgi:haloalkane dehalogenase